MKALVTGGNGFIGSELIKTLEIKGFFLKLLSRQDNKNYDKYFGSRKFSNESNQSNNHSCINSNKSSNNNLHTINNKIKIEKD